ncbi:MAG: hypothetical protein EHM47_12205 [Ignavibacteriales bacterium]|nr:MAG: hypothetical protein EHM47_12205 [Ignavibacteriales bacterium]
MKQFSKIFLAIFIAFFLFNTNSFAQDGSYYTVTTWKITTPEGGTNAEFNEIMKEWYDKVVSKNEKIISERVLRHLSGSDGRDWIFITEYASWNDINDAATRQNELVQEAWPDEGDRREFFRKFFSYTGTHSDEILQEIPDLRK